MVENIGVLVIFFVLIVIAMIFYFAFQSASIEEKQGELKIRNALEITSKVSMLPELQCRKNKVAEAHCFDALKIDSAKLLFAQTQNEDYYFQQMGFSTIKVKWIYPYNDEKQIYHKTMPEYTNNDTSRIPISLYDPITNSYDYGILEVNVYS